MLDLDSQQAKGEKKPKATLTESDVRDIRRRYIPYGIDNLNVLAAEFSVTTRTIFSVAKGETWRHVV